MKITVECCDVQEPACILRCAALDDECLRVLALLNTRQQRLCAWQENRELIFLSPADVYYCESVDDRTFLYCEREVYQTALRLAELEARYDTMGLFRVGKSMVVNLYKIARLKSCANSRIEATMQNGEKILVSRHYAPLLREKLEI